MNQTLADQILTLRNVSYRYPDGTVGLNDCSFSIRRGSRTALLGANGAGKTTLFLHLNGILIPERGTVLSNGTELDYSRQGLHKLRAQIGLVFQNPDSQLFSASVREDVSFGPLNLGLDSTTVRQRVEEALVAVGMTDCAEKPVHNLSYGQKKRVCIAGVLAMRPKVLILDEPMAGLDIAMQSELMQILAQLHGDGMTIIIATHDMDFAYQWADSMTIMVNGSCAATWDFARIAEELERVAAYGIGIPKVAELQRALQSGGFFAGGEPLLRNHQELLHQLKINSRLQS